MVELDTATLDARLGVLNRPAHRTAINRFVGEISADRKPVVWPALAPSPLSSAARKVLESVQ